MRRNEAEDGGKEQVAVRNVELTPQQLIGRRPHLLGHVVVAALGIPVGPDAPFTCGLKRQACQLLA